MMSVRQILPALFVTVILFLGSPALAYHWEGEAQNEEYMSKAGDPNVLRDGADCLNEVADREGVSCVVLYGHLFDLQQRVPINVQPPPWCAPDVARGFTGEIHTGSSKTERVIYSSPGFVEYKEGACGGPDEEEPRIHPERGLTSDVRIDEEVPVYGYWYLSADAGEFTPLGVGSGPEAEPSAGLMPCVTVRMQMWTKHFVGQGKLLAEGTTTKTVLSTPAATDNDTDDLKGQVADVCEGSEGTVDPERVSEFRVHMEPQEDLLIPEFEGYVIRVQWYQHDGGNPDENPNLLQRQWNMHTGGDFPNRIVMAVEDAIRFDEMWIREFGDLLYVRGSMNTPWGSYDVDTRNMRIALLDEDGAEIPMEHLEEPRVTRSVDHDGHFKPVNVTWGWDVRQQDLEPGTYTVRLLATNWQHTQDTAIEESFTLSEDGIKTEGEPEPEDVKKSPAAGFWVVPVMVLALLVRTMGRSGTSGHRSGPARAL